MTKIFDKEFKLLVGRDPPHLGFCENVTIGANSTSNNNISITDGASTGILWQDSMDTGTGAVFATNVAFDFVVFVNSGETLRVISSAVDCVIAGSIRQVADLQGNLVNPSGFSSE